MTYTSIKVLALIDISLFLSSGTTWVSYILDLLYFSQTRPDRQTSTPIYERVPFLENKKPNHPSGKIVIILRFSPLIKQM